MTRALPPDDTLLRFLTQSSWLRDALSELDPSIEKLTFVGNPKIEEPDGRRRAANAAAPPLFRIRAEGSYGSTEMDYPDDREVLETFECVRTIQYRCVPSYISLPPIPSRLNRNIIFAPM